MKNPFHLAIPVHDLAKAIDFYEDMLGCKRGRATDSWIDFNLFGHQLVCHFVKKIHTENTNPVTKAMVQTNMPEKNKMCFLTKSILQTKYFKGISLY